MDSAKSRLSISHYSGPSQNFSLVHFVAAVVPPPRGSKFPGAPHTRSIPCIYCSSGRSFIVPRSEGRAGEAIQQDEASKITPKQRSASGYSQSEIELHIEQKVVRNESSSFYVLYRTIIYLKKVISFSISFLNSTAHVMYNIYSYICIYMLRSVLSLLKYLLGQVFQTTDLKSVCLLYAYEIDVSKHFLLHVSNFIMPYAKRLTTGQFLPLKGQSN